MVNLTTEQIEALKSTTGYPCTVVQARAGTGKTTLATSWAEFIDSKEHHGVYVTYNRAASNHAQQKFADAGLTEDYVTASTIHAYALKHCFPTAPNRIQRSASIRWLNNRAFGQDKENPYQKTPRWLIRLRNYVTTPPCVQRFHRVAQLCKEHLVGLHPDDDTWQLGMRLSKESVWKVIDYHGISSILVRDPITGYELPVLEITAHWVHQYLIWQIVEYKAGRIPMMGYEDLLWLPVVTGQDIPMVDNLLIDEAHDLTPLYLQFFQMMGTEKCRYAYLLDPEQAIYQWKGSIPDIKATLGRIHGARLDETEESSASLQRITQSHRVPLTQAQRCRKRMDIDITGNPQRKGKVLYVNPDDAMKILGGSKSIRDNSLILTLDHKRAKSIQGKLEEAFPEEDIDYRAKPKVPENLSLEEYCDWLDQNETYEGMHVELGENAYKQCLRLMTFWPAKGLEAEFVFIWGSPGDTTHYGNDAAEYYEIMRPNVEYVALTRSLNYTFYVLGNDKEGNERIKSRHTNFINWHTKEMRKTIEDDQKTIEK